MFVLHSVFRYDGYCLRWRFARGNCREGVKAGKLVKGRIVIKLGGVQYNALDLVWLYHHWQLPARGVTTEDGDPLNTHLSNIIPRNPRSQVIIT